MGLHNKHEPLDQIVHFLLVRATFPCAAPSRSHALPEPLRTPRTARPPAAGPGAPACTSRHLASRARAGYASQTLAFSAATIITAAEALLPGSFALAAARPMLMVLIGTWFVQIGRILFMGEQWQMN